MIHAALTSLNFVAYIASYICKCATEADIVQYTDAEVAYFTLNLANVTSRYCGVYICSAMDNFTGLPSTGNAIVCVDTKTWGFEKILKNPFSILIIRLTWCNTFTLRNG